MKVTGVRFGAAKEGSPSWLGLPLRERQERAFLLAGHTFGEPAGGPLIAIRQDVALTAEAVRKLAEAGAASGKDISWRADGRHGAFIEEFAPLGPPEPLAVYLVGGDVSEERIREAEPTEIGCNERLLELPVPAEQFGFEVLELPISDALVFPTHHWLQLLWANLLGLGPFLWRELAGRNVVEVGARLGLAALRAGSLNPARVAGKLGRKGRGSRIHPSAVVEGCWLGDGVEIGAFAVVRGSVLADGVVVEDQALVEFSVLAPKSRVQRRGFCKFSVMDGGSSLGGTMQLGVLGPNAVVKHGAVLMDMRFGGGVRVQGPAGLVSAPLGLAGVFVGDGSMLGASVHVAPGRSIPPGLTISAPDAVLSRIDPALEGRVCVKDGALVPE